MKTINQIKNIISAHKEILARKYKISKIGIFGSYVRQEAKKSSDLDVLVEFNKVMIGLLGFIEIENYLSGLLGVKVDLVMNGALKPRIGKQIMREIVYI